MDVVDVSTIQGPPTVIPTMNPMYPMRQGQSRQHTQLAAVHAADRVAGHGPRHTYRLCRVHVDRVRMTAR
jgi:hypothetical protein